MWSRQSNPTDPEKKIIGFLRLEQQACNIIIKPKEDQKVTKGLERDKAFRAPIQAEPRPKGMIATLNRPGEAELEGKVRVLREGKVEFGRAWTVPLASFPAKLVIAVPSGSDELPESRRGTSGA